MANLITATTQPPLKEVAKLGPYASHVYGVLWQSATADVRYDKDLTKPWSERRDCGGTTNWSVKGLADYLSINKKTVIKALNVLQDEGFIISENYIRGSGGQMKSTWRVVHPNQLEHRRHAIGFLPELPSVTRNKWLSHKKPNQQDLDMSEFYDFLNSELPAGHYAKYDSYEERLEHLIDLAVED